MFDRLIRLALRHRLVVVATAALLLVYGALAATRIPIDVLPDLDRPRVSVMTEAEGLAPEEVEALVTFPIERALAGAPGVRRIRSTSGIGLSAVHVEFEESTDVYLDRQIVAERLATVAAGLPAGVVPHLGPVSSIMGEIMLVGLLGDASPAELRTFADWVIRPRLLTVPGVAQVIPIGGAVRQVHVVVDPARLAATGVSLEEVARALSASSANATGGYVDRRGLEFLVRAQGRARTPAELASTTVALRDGRPLALSQVADVREGARTARGDASIDGEPAVILSVHKQPEADTLLVTDEVDRALAALERELPPGARLDARLFRQSSFIESAVGNVLEAMRDGSLLVVVVLFLFLLNLRTTAITLTAIPLSLLVALLVFHAFGMSVNTMTLGGLAVAIGELVDDAIVDVENVFRRLQENARLATPRPALLVIAEASSEVRGSIVYATVIVVLVFLPLFALGGIEGRLFAPLGVAYIVSILASLLVSLTVTPALCSYLLPRAKLATRDDSWLVRRLKGLDRAALRATLPRPTLVLAGAGALTVAAVAALPSLGGEFLPPFHEGTLTVNVLAPPATSLEASNRLGTLAEELLRAIPEVARTGRRTGRAELDEHAEGVHSSEIDVELRPSRRSRAEIVAEVRARLAEIPGLSVSVGQPISHRVDHLLSGVRAPIAVKIFGHELAELRRVGHEVRARMLAVPDIEDVQLEQQTLIPHVSLRVQRERAAQVGVLPGDVARQVELALRGEVVTELLDGERSVDVVLRYPPEVREDLDALRRLPIDAPAGAKIPLGQLAEVVETTGPNQIGHDHVQRRIVIAANTSGRDLDAVVAGVRRAVSAVPLPPGFRVELEGQHESQRAARRLIALLSLASLSGMFLVLYAHFRSVMLAAQVLLNIPLALIGSVVAVFLTGGVLSIASLVGFITLCGIAARNGVMMLSHYVHLMREEGEVFGEAMVTRGSLERLVPVLMTALTAALALLPIALSRDAPGKEILQPVAVVILGGLISSTLLDVVVTPVVFLRFGRAAAERLAAAPRSAPREA